jgi:hypothetical protein
MRNNNSVPLVTINILVGTKELGRSLIRYLTYLIQENEIEFRLLIFDDMVSLSHDILGAQLWLIEALHPFKDNSPEGFRVAYKLASFRGRVVLFFLHTPSEFPEKGPFWCNVLSQPLIEKVSEALSNPPPSKEDFDRLIEQWPVLGKISLSHHSHGNGLIR